MKATVEVSDALLKQAKAIAAREHSTVKAVVEEGLRKVASERERAKPFQLRKVSFGGNGLQPRMAGASWKQSRDAAYKARGA